MLAALLLVAFVNLCIGVFSGYAIRLSHEKEIQVHLEKEVYCHGYEDGFYLGVGEYDPDLFRKEIAEKAYQEYKGIKYGPTKH